MIKKLADGRTILLGQRKSDADIKVGYVLKRGTWKLKYQGKFEGLKKWLKHQRELAARAYARQMVAEMCGTSYEAACEDMGDRPF
jgi:hypothetical protein